MIASINEPITNRITAISKKRPFHLIFKLSLLKLCLINIIIVIRIIISAIPMNIVGRRPAFELNFPSLAAIVDVFVIIRKIRTIS